MIFVVIFAGYGMGIYYFLCGETERDFMRVR